MMNPIDIPTFQLQTIVDHIPEDNATITCAQALGSEIYIGCSNGSLWRYALQANSNQLESYQPLSHLPVNPGKPIDQLVLVPSIMKVLVLCDQILHFYQLPSLAPVSYNQIRPIRGIVVVAVDQNHINRPPPPVTGPVLPILPVDLCCIKRSQLMSTRLTIVMYSLKEKLSSQREMPCPEGVTKAIRINRSLYLADASQYNMVDLEKSESFPLIPLCQEFDRKAQFNEKPQMIVTGEDECLVASWMAEGNTIGVFFSTKADPVRGTLQWPAFPKSLSLDYPYITALLPNEMIEIHDIQKEQVIDIAPVQVIAAPLEEEDASVHRISVVSVPHEYLVPSHQRSEKMALRQVKLLREPEVERMTTNHRLEK